MVGAPACRVNQTTSYSRDEQLVGDLELHDRVELLLAHEQHRIKLLGLRDCARETVQDKAGDDMS